MTGYQSKKAAARDKIIEVAKEGMSMHSPDAPEYIVCEALIEALAQPAQERQWIWLSDADIADVVDTTCQYTGGYEEYLIKKAERKIRSINNGT